MSKRCDRSRTTCRTCARRLARRQGARPIVPRRGAVVVPSLFPETFGYVVLEAFAVRTPVIVNLNGGALAETGFASGGGLGYRTDLEWIDAARLLIRNRDLRDELADRGFAKRAGDWSEAAHLDRYFELIKSLRASRSLTPHSRKAGDFDMRAEPIIERHDDPW